MNMAGAGIFIGQCDEYCPEKTILVIECILIRSRGV